MGSLTFNRVGLPICSGGGWKAQRVASNFLQNQFSFLICIISAKVR